MRETLWERGSVDTFPGKRRRGVGEILASGAAARALRGAVGRGACQTRRRGGGPGNQDTGDVAQGEREAGPPRGKLAEGTGQSSADQALTHREGTGWVRAVDRLAPRGTAARSAG